jgi:hypothetical protein
MMAQTDSRGHLYGTPSRPAIRVSLAVVLFALAYAALLFGIGIVPINRFVARLVGPAMMPGIWRSSMIQAIERTAAAAFACWVGLAVSKRGRGRLTGAGMIALGVLMSGALAGALDVGLHRLWVRQMARAAYASPLAGSAFSLGLTAAVSLVITLLFITRSTRVASAE